jgi:hypothetical protein
MNSIFVPFDKSKESMTKYFQRMELFNININKSRYDGVLDVLNKALKTEHKSLTDIKNISETVIIKNNKHITDTFNENSNFLAKLLYIDMFDLICITDEDTNNITHIMNYIKCILNVLNYKIISKTKYEKKFYSIIN